MIEENEVIYDAVIVGGGISGITTAYMLRDKNILLLEKTCRFGGKVLTENVYGTVNNIGTQFFSNTDSTLRNFFDELEIEYVSHSSKKTPYAFYVNDEFFPNMKSFVTPRVKLDALKVFSRAIPNALKFLKPDSDKWNELVSQNVAGEYEGLSPRTVTLINTYMRAACLAKPERTSKGVGSALMMGPFAMGEVGFVKGGFETVTNAMLDKIRDNVKENCEVLSIEDKDGIVRTQYVNAGKTYVVKSRRSVVTTEAPIVSKIIPNLPEWKRTALEGVEYGPLTMVSVVFKREIPWDRFFMLMSDSTIFQAMFDQTLNSEDDIEGIPLVCNFIIAEYPDEKAKIEKFFALSDNEIINMTLKDFSKVLSDKYKIRDYVIDSKVTRFRLGEIELSPTYYTEYLPHLSKPVGNIYFAGDYTHFLSFIEGAVYSAFDVSRALGSKHVIAKEDEYYIKSFLGRVNAFKNENL